MKKVRLNISFLHRIWLSKILLAGLVILLVMGFATVRLTRKNQTEQSTKPKQVIGYDAAIEATKLRIKTATRDDEKISYNLSLANACRGKKDFDCAEKAALVALSVGGDVRLDVLSFLGSFYEERGDKQQALSYYKKIKDVLSAQGAVQPDGGTLLEQVNKKIQSLKAGS